MSHNSKSESTSLTLVSVRHRLGNERGDTLISILIAFVVIGISSLFLLPAFVGTMKAGASSATPGNLCREVAQNALSAIRSSGTRAMIFNAPVDSEDKDTTLADIEKKNKTGFNPKGVESELGAHAKVRWPKERVISNKNPPFIVNTPLLIQSSVNGLLSLYNMQGNRVCKNKKDKGLPLTQKKLGEELAGLVPVKIDGYTVDAYLRIQPYNLADGELEECKEDGHDLRIRPLGIREPPEAVASGLIKFDNYKHDQGLEAEVSVSLLSEDESIAPVECSLTERFEYDRVSQKPRAPTIDYDKDIGQITISMPEGDPGNQMVCREDSERKSDRDLAKDAQEYFQDKATYDEKLLSVKEWVPCHELEMCGSKGTRSVDQKNATITKTFSVPDDCSFKVEARAFDIAGNLSGVRAISGRNKKVDKPDRTFDDDDGDSETSGYEVGGIQFKTREAAQDASIITGIRIRAVARVTQTQDDYMESVAKGMVDGYVESKTAETSELQAEGVIANSNSYLNASKSSASASGAQRAAASAMDVATRAGVAAGVAADAAKAAAKALEQVSSALTEGRLGEAIGDVAHKAAVYSAKVAQDAANAAQRAYDEALRAALEAERIAREKAAAEAAAAAKEKESCAANPTCAP